MSPSGSGHRAVSESRLKLAAEIKWLHNKREPLNITAVRENHPALLLDAYRGQPFLGWKGALELAGLDYSKIKVELPKHVACKICGMKRKALHEHIRFCHQMSPREYVEMHRGAPLASDAFKALCASPGHGVMPQWEPVWSPEYVLDRLNEFHKAGIRLNPSNIEQKEDVCYHWALRFFKKWDVVLEGLGLNPDTERKATAKTHWTKESLVREVRRLRLKGHEVNWRAMFESHRYVTYAALKLFGAYDNLLKAAGFSPASVRKLPVCQVPYKTMGDVISGICRRKVKELPLNYQGVAKGASRDLPLYNKARRLFGTWQKAIEAAGMNYDKVILYRNQYLTPDAVLDEIRKRHAAGKPLTYVGVRKGLDKDGLLYDRASKHFGTWTQAVEKAGVQASASRGKYSDE